MEENKIILFTDLVEQRLRQEKEIEFYEEQLKEIQKKLYWLNRDYDLTKTIINMINTDSVKDLRENTLLRKED